MAENRDPIAEKFRATESKVEKIREILIGEQMQTMERRIEAIERQVAQEIVNVRNGEMRLTALESALEKEITALSERNQRILGTYDKLLRSLETAVANNHDEIAKHISSLNARLLEQGTEFRKQLDRHGTDLRSSRQTLQTELTGLLISELREIMIRDAARRRAEQRGFVGGDPKQDWREAEAEVERNLQKKFKHIKMNTPP